MTLPITIAQQQIGAVSHQLPADGPPPRRRGYCPPRDGVARVPTSMRLLPATVERLQAAAQRDGTGIGVVIDHLAQLLPESRDQRPA